MSATSLGAILASSSTVFVAVTWLGAAYLLWMGASMLLFPTTGATAVPDTTPRSSLRRSVVRGFVTQVVNPHTLVFFTALLPQFIDPARPVTSQVLVLGISTVVIEAVTMMLYVAVCHGARSWFGAPRFAAGLQRIGGALLIGAGARLAAIRHAAG